MKNLLYKEFKLAVHPLIFVFVIAFPFMALIPSYPLSIGFIYVASCYPILFLGSNKGQQSNDIFYSCLLPVRKKDVVLARIMTLAILLAVFITLECVAATLSSGYKEEFLTNPEFNEEMGLNTLGFTADGMLALIGCALISFAVYDYIFITCFYKNGRSILLPTFAGLFVFMILLFGSTILLPALSLDFFNMFNGEGSFINQISLFVVGLLFYIGGHFLAYKRGSAIFEKVDF